jgi:cell shape-determining protein MreC
MKKIKIVLAILILAFIITVIIQNQGFFLSKQTIGLHLGVVDPYTSPEVYVAVIFVACFLAGLLIAYMFGLFEQFRKNKALKQLNATVDSQQKEISSLKMELEAAKAALTMTPGEEPPAKIIGDAEKTQPLDETIDSTHR